MFTFIRKHKAPNIIEILVHLTFSLVRDEPLSLAWLLRHIYISQAAFQGGIIT